MKMACCDATRARLIVGSTSFSDTPVYFHFDDEPSFKTAFSIPFVIVVLCENLALRP